MGMKKWLIGWLAFSVVLSLQAQRKTQNLVIVTLDGLRWQEVFGGIDSFLVADHKFTRDSGAVIKNFGASTADGRRKKLFPFFWTTIAKDGQLYGNRWKGSEANVANHYHFSYPGYNEIFTGYPDTAVNSNGKVWNKNENVLEFINKQKGYEGRVAAFTSWDVFSWIFNEPRSGFLVNSDEPLAFDNPALSLINDMQKLGTRPLDVRPDVLTYFAAREYLKAYRPKVLYIGLDETDDFAHREMYDQYLQSAHASDAMIADLWSWIQGDKEYADQTTMIITCDHGRGDKKKVDWTSHADDIIESREIWIAVIGPDVNKKGEMQSTTLIEQRQLAATFAAMLGFDFKANHPVALPIDAILDMDAKK